MRGSRAKRLRREHPERANPGRKHGGEHKKANRKRAKEVARSVPKMPKVRFKPRSN